MAGGVTYDEDALQRVMDAAAGAMDDLGQEGAGLAMIYIGSRRWPRKRGRKEVYKRTFAVTTYVGDRVRYGRALRNRAKIGGTKHDIQTIVYTSSMIAHLLEFGTQPHDIPVMVEHGPFAMKVVKHPGARPYPHMRPAALASAQRGAEIISAGMARRLK
jgi:hypothetical protein